MGIPRREVAERHSSLCNPWLEVIIFSLPILHGVTALDIVAFSDLWRFDRSRPRLCASVGM
jgi:hypothetical protein